MSHFESSVLINLNLEISNEDSILSPPRDVEIVNNSHIEENMHVTTKTITMQEQFYSSGRQEIMSNSIEEADESAQMVRSGGPSKVFTAKFEATGTPEKNNFMSEEVTTQEIPVPVMKTSPPKDNIARYKNVKTRE